MTQTNLCEVCLNPNNMFQSVSVIKSEIQQKDKSIVWGHEKVVGNFHQCFSVL